ncbi:MAG: hypothetical protein ABH827_03010 [bacterium]
MKPEVHFALNNLEAIYKRLITIDDPDVFATVLNEFYIELITVSSLEQMTLEIQQKHELLVSTLQKPKKDALEEMEKRFVEIKDFVKKENITNVLFLETLAKFQDPSEYESGLVWNKFIAMNMIMITLYMIPKGKTCIYAMKPAEMKTEAESDIESFKTECSLPQYWTWHEKKLALYSTNEIREGESLKKIEDFFNCYSVTQYEKHRKEKIKKGQNTKLLHKCYQSFSVGKFSGIPKSYYDTEFEAPRSFLVQEFKQHAGRVFGAIQKILQPKNTIEFHRSSGKFKYNNEEIKFKLETPSWTILDLLITSSGPKKNKILKSETARSEILKKYDQSKDDPDIYEICRAINKRIANSFGLTNFLIFENETIRINPSYLD